MLKHTKKIAKIYEDIQKMIIHMIPEKWENLYLYASIMEEDKGKEGGELFFYYVPKGIFKKKPINVYEIPSKFNIDEQEYLKLVEALYSKIKELRQEFKPLGPKETWSNLTIIINNTRFMVEYHYEDLLNSPLSSYERHVIWRCKYLDIAIEQLTREEKEILKKYASGPKTIDRVKRYETTIYLKEFQNTVDYDTTQTMIQEEKEDEQEKEPENEIRTQILAPIKRKDINNTKKERK